LTLIVHLAIGSAITYFIKPLSALIAGIIGAVAGIFFSFIFNMGLPKPELTNLLTSAGIASFYAALSAFLAGSVNLSTSPDRISCQILELN